MKLTENFIILILLFLTIGNKGFTQTNKPLKTEKPKVLILTPYDINGDFTHTIEIQELLEKLLIDNSEIELIKFPFKKLMNVPYQNIYDKKYCKPILGKVKADIIIMSKLEVENELNPSRIWDFDIRIYNVKSDKQLDSKLNGRNLKKEQVENKIKTELNILITEIEKTFANKA